MAGTGSSVSARRLTPPSGHSSLPKTPADPAQQTFMFDQPRVRGFWRKKRSASGQHRQRRSGDLKGVPEFPSLRRGAHLIRKQKRKPVAEGDFRVFGPGLVDWPLCGTRVSRARRFACKYSIVLPVRRVWEQYRAAP